jgi:hypothetical protein
MLGLHCAANEISLDFVAIGLPQEIELLGAFDTLCGNSDLQLPGQSSSLWIE